MLKVPTLKSITKSDKYVRNQSIQVYNMHLNLDGLRKEEGPGPHLMENGMNIYSKLKKNRNEKYEKK